MADRRPDPDTLLRQLQADDARARRGRLKIFFGASAGVGKTFAMLAAAQGALAEGRVLVAAVVETHGRADTEAMARGLPRLPLKEIAHRDGMLREFDLDAALAFGAEHPGGLVLLDELAHSNATGSRHPKRWQDVEELLTAGVDVWSTVNVQHLESLNDIVSGITGVRVWETVPDRVFDAADEVVVVDLPPDELLARLRAGKVYLPQQAERAAANFFRKGNLLALRELALRRTADRVDGQMQDWRRGSAVQRVWPNREALLACIGPGAHGEKIVRSSARLAAQLQVDWHAVMVETPALLRLPEARRQQPLRVLRLAQEMGATTATLSAPQAAPALVRYAREHNLSRLVVGRRDGRWQWSWRWSSRWPWRWPWQPTLAQRLADEGDDLDVLQVALPNSARADGATPAEPATQQPVPLAPYAWAAGACAATVLAATPLASVFDLSNIVMLFLLTVVGVAVALGRGPALLAAVLGVALFDFFFVPPRFDFAVSDVQYLVTFAVMLVVALVIGQLTAGLKSQAAAATRREHRVRRLYAMARDLSAALLPGRVAEIGAQFLHAEFGARSALLVADNDNQLQTLEGATAHVDAGLAQWAFDSGEAAGRGTDTLPSSTCLVLPLKAPMRVRGVMAVETAASTPRTLAPEQRQLLDTCASLLAISLERIHYIDVAQSSTVQIETERLRNSLLSAISHDLRTPLTALVGLGDALTLTRPAPTPQQAEIAAAIQRSARQMHALLNNLLDMARLEAGAVRLHRAWQPLEEVVGSALAACQPALQGHGVDVDLDEGLPLLELDAVLMERVLVNLVENACKYGDATGRIAIHAAVHDGQAVVHIDNAGPGLPAGREESIFDKFERGHKESAQPGVGLGLAIARAIVQVHGGTVRGTTRRDGDTVLGARFTIVLPLGSPPQDDGADLVPAAAETGAA